MQKVVTQQFAAVSMILWPGMDLGIFCIWKLHRQPLDPAHHGSTDAPSIPESLSSNTDRHEISQALSDELPLCTTGKLRLEVQCLLARFSPSLPSMQHFCQIGLCSRGI